MLTTLFHLAFCLRHCFISTALEATNRVIGNVDLIGFVSLQKKLYAKFHLSEDTAPGKYSVVWDGKNDAGQQVASGVYIYQMAANAIDNDGSGSFVQSKKLMLLK